MNSFFWTIKCLPEVIRFSPLLMMKLLVIYVLEKTISILALMLPLKVIMLASNDGVPAAIQVNVDWLSKYELVGYLFCGVIFLFVLSYLLSKWVGAFKNKLKGKIVECCGEENKEVKVIHKFNVRLVNAFSEVVYLFIGMMLVLFISWKMFFSLLAIFVFLIVIGVLFLKENTPGEDDENSGVLVDIGFVMCFSMIVYNVLLGEVVDVFSMLLFFIVLRKNSAGLKRIIKDVSWFSMHRNIIDKFYADRMSVK